MFFDEILWMSNTGVTEGYSDGTFRPNDPVTRKAMAAFMQRLYNVQEDSDWSSGDSFTTTTSQTWSDVPGATTTVRVPEGVYANIFARFSAESECTGTAGQWCSVRLMISKDGAAFLQMYPDAGTDSAFDSTGIDNWESHTIERVRYGDPGSTYTIKVQYAVSSPGVTFGVDDWLLVAETDLQPSDYIPF